MRRLILVCLLVPAIAHSQTRLHITAFGGFSNYQGDLQPKAITANQSHGAFGLGLMYSVTPKIAIRGEGKYGRIEASDSKNPPSLAGRNLSFGSKLYEASLLGEYSFFDTYERRFTPYLFAGIAIYHFSPYTFDTTGKKIFLMPLGTEGQGLPEYPDKKLYKLNQIAIPFGAGIKLRVTDNAVLGFEIGMRKTFTDYLDDVSTRYADPFALLAGRGQEAVNISYRGDELKDGNPNYPTGAKRGGEKYKDWYYFTGITLAIGINTGRLFGGEYRDSKRGSVGCPKNVY